MLIGLDSAPAHTRIITETQRFQTDLPKSDTCSLRQQEPRRSETAPLTRASSRFSLGAEHVLEGFDEGVATMRQGERALLELSPDVAYVSVGARDETLSPVALGLGSC